jgi:hypothetical protein
VSQAVRTRAFLTAAGSDLSMLVAVIGVECCVASHFSTRSILAFMVLVLIGISISQADIEDRRDNR